MKAKKSYGQHFLNKKDIAERIANGLLAAQTGDVVLEVGPGKGMLTQFLLEKKYDLWAVEADKDMVTYLNIHFPKLKDNLISQDFLRTDLAALFPNSNIFIIGNFPYNISSQIVFKMLDFKQQIPELVGMFQREMAKRIIAPPGSKDYGVISVLTQAFYEGDYMFDVDSSCFSPPPQVQSAVIRLRRKSNLDLGCDEVLYKQIVKQAFGQRRKMLRNTLRSFFVEESDLQDAFFNQRPEMLSVQAFVDLTNLIKNQAK